MIIKIHSFTPTDEMHADGTFEPLGRQDIDILKEAPELFEAVYDLGQGLAVAYFKSGNVKLYKHVN
jgi:hypothetical protein